MKKINYWLVVFLSLFLFSLFSPAVSGSESGFLEGFSLPPKNYVRNGDFSGPMEPSWHLFKDVGGGTFRGIINEGEDGGPCFKVSGSFNDTLTIEQLFIPSDTALEPGKTYTLSVSFKAEGITGVEPGKIFFFLNYGWHGDSIPFGPSAATTSNWERRTFTFVAPPTNYPLDGYKYAIFLWWPKGANGTLWMDNVQIEDGDKSTAFTPQHNYTIKVLVDDLKRAYDGANKIKKNISENFSGSPLAGSLLGKFTGFVSEIEKMGNDLFSSNLSPAKVSEFKDRVAGIQKEVGSMTCFAWYKNPYLHSTERDFPDMLGEPKSKKITAYVNETRNLGVIFTNLSGHSIDYRIAPQRFKHAESGLEIDGKDFVMVYEAPLIRGKLNPNGLFTDPLPTTNEMNGICVPGGESRQIILSINTRGIMPGTYKGLVLLDALDSASLAKKLELEISVLPVRLPDKVPVDVCPLGATFLRPEESLRLGHNLMPLLVNVPIYLDDKGNLNKPIDYTALDWKVRESKAVNPDCKFVMLFSLGLQFINMAERFYGYKWPEERLKTGWKNWVKDVASHMQSLGVGLDAFYLQVVDEPQTGEPETELSRLAKEAVPGLKLMTYGGDPRTQSELFKYTDIFYPGSAMLSNPDFITEVIENRGKTEVGIYDCREFNEMMIPLTYRRLMPWKVWKYNLAGWSYWSRDDREPNWSSVKYMSVLYPLAEGEFGRLLTPDIGYVISRHWLAMEAGYQDYKALYLLKKVLSELNSRGVTGAGVNAAQEFLQSAPDKALALDNPAKFPFEMAAGVDPDTLDRLREEMAGLTAKLHQQNKFELRTVPSLDEKGNLSFTANRPCTFRAEYVVDGKLPRHEVAVEKEAIKHVIKLDKFNGQVINQCRLDIFSDDGQVLTSSPLVEGRLSVDSTNEGYEYSCLVDGIRYPGAQFWPSKTWISAGTPTEHWVRLDWERARPVQKVIISWMTFGGLPEAYKVQYLEANDWKDVFDWRRAPAGLDVIEFAPVTATGIRVIQKQQGGGYATRDLMGISEIEIY